MCGIIGIVGTSSVVQQIYDGLIVLQHRGQDSAGIVTYDGHFFLKKGNGLVRDVFNAKHMLTLKGTMGLGHVRYTTAGSFDASGEAQPFYVNSPYGITLIHNGNLTNYVELKNQITKGNSRYLNTGSDTEALINVVADEIGKEKKEKLEPHEMFSALKRVYGRVKGSYSVIAIVAGHGLIAFRDPYGIRPLVLGKRETSQGTEYVVASESVALDTLGFEVVRDIAPGEAIYITAEHELHSARMSDIKWAPCIFEHVYIARPDSVLDKVSVYKSRLRMGKFLGEQIKKEMAKGMQIDVVIPVPDTARNSAVEIASTIGVPYREGLIKNRYIGRTFIMPGQQMRQKSIKYKLNPIPLEIEGKNVLLVDDSIVRGNTSRKIVEMVRGAGAKKVFFASCCPPLKDPCVYGVDMPSRKEFIANNLSIDEIGKALNVDGMFYQKLEDLKEAVQTGNPEIKNFCMACLDGKYPTPEVTEEMLTEVERARKMAIEKATDSTRDEDPEDQLALL
ncbi:amidophosphoribosyltransferase [Candidatus Gracilibacteria bacterium]|nr:amidophosphoribosyltransferase [Candidatus Gracilibacteria bacterium]